MSDADFSATFTRRPGFTDVRLTRQWDCSTDNLWRRITDPDRIAQWLAPGKIEARAGGAVRLDFEGSGTVIESTVTAFQDGHVFEFSWSAPGEPLRPVRIEVERAPGGARLTVTVSTPETEDAAKAAAGWEAHLGMLDAALADAPIPFPFDRFKAAREAYRPLVAALPNSPHP